MTSNMQNASYMLLFFARRTSSAHYGCFHAGIDWATTIGALPSTAQARTPGRALPNRWRPRMIRPLLDWWELGAALVVFFASHAIPARPDVRAWLIERVGRRTYLLGYATISVIALGWLIASADRAPHSAIWPYSPWQTWVPNAVMPIACLLLAFGAAAPNPLSIASRNDDAFDPDHPGIAGIARHPLLWAGAFWAFAHSVPNGDLAHILLFGSLGAFSLLGMPAIDARKRRMLGASEWYRLAHRTSQFPFAAVLCGKWRPTARRFNWYRLTIAIVIYAGLRAAHQPVIGVSPWPQTIRLQSSWSALKRPASLPPGQGALIRRASSM